MKAYISSLEQENEYWQQERIEIWTIQIVCCECSYVACYAMRANKRKIKASENQIYLHHLPFTIFRNVVLL